MKRTFSFVLSFILSTAILAGSFGNTQVLAAQTAPPPVKVIIDDQQIICSPAPQIVNDRILIPLRSVFESLGYTVDWDDHFKLATGKMKTADGSRNVSLSTTMLSMAVWEISGGDRISFILPLDPQNAPIRDVDNRLLLPIGVIAQALGCEVKWDGETRTATINTSGAKISPPVGWVQAIETHYAKYAPEQLSAKQSWIDEETENQRILAMDAHSDSDANLSKPVEQQGKKYSVFSTRYNKSFEYEYKNPAIPTKAPIVGSVPAKILLDESVPTTSIPDPKNPGQWLDNRTEAYIWAGSAVVGGCNWYAGGRFKEIYGIPFGCFDKIRKAEDYLDSAALYNEFLVIRDINDVRDCSIVVYGKGNFDSGHVAFVEYVERDVKGNPINIYFTEANVNNTTGNYQHGIDGAVQKLSITDFLNRSKPTIGYIVPNPEFYK